MDASAKILIPVTNYSDFLTVPHLIALNLDKIGWYFGGGGFPR